NENLVYYLNLIDTCQQFFVFKTLEKKIFKMMHDDHYHVSFHQVYNNIVADLYIQNLSQCLKQYITHCFKCLHYQTARHTSYRALQSIEFKIKCKIHQQKIQDSIVWTNLVMKNCYDRHHISLLLNLR